MAIYDRSKIRNVLSSLATVYEIPAKNWMLTYGTAMVMHDLETATGDLDITVKMSDWDTLIQFHKPYNDALGPIIELPGKIEIRPIATLQPETVFVTIDGCRVADMPSLLGAYKSLLAQPLEGRNKMDKDFQRSVQLELRIEQLGQMHDIAFQREGDLIAEAAVDLIIYANLSKIMERVKERNRAYKGYFEDAGKVHWVYQIETDGKTIEVRDTNDGVNYRVQIEAI